MSQAQLVQSAQASVPIYARQFPSLDPVFLSWHHGVLTYLCGLDPHHWQWP